MTRDFQTRTRAAALPRSTRLALGLGVLLLALSVYDAWRVRREQASAESLLETERRGLQSLQQAAEERQSERAGIDETLVSQAFLSLEAPPAVLMAALEKALPADVRLTNITLTYGRELAVEMHVIARRPAAYDDFLARLGAASFHDVVPAVESREDGVQATVRARFAGTL
jgi:Tfp pilus assembly protein PilN